MRAITRLACSLALAASLAGCAGATADTADDPTIATRVKIAMLGDPALGTERIDARCFKGVVTLSGTVKSKEDEQHAVEIARKMNGVRDVKSELRIQPGR
jgi:hyperosmotically inducible periplasmic protein